jgi:hypothetical protein
MWPFKKRSDPSQEAPHTQHHYVLAHVAFRTVCRQNPLAFFALMASPERDGFLEVLWQDVCKNSGAPGPASFGIRDLSFKTGRIKGFPCLLIRMPPPRSMAEAHMVCAVLRENMEEPVPEHPEVGYYTLEKGFNMDGSERTVLCAWMGDGSHVNYGDGPPATDEAFLAAVEGLLG